ncbi:hypothetical protein [Desulfitobacterium dehalogenans]|uniref:hypothetical protein n=1 Tax=Desulfitobacterium dehalogenans TaxID=36854 RepID=UPI0005A54196
MKTGSQETCLEHCITPTSDGCGDYFGITEGKNQRAAQGSFLFHYKSRQNWAKPKAWLINEIVVKQRGR